MAAVLWRDVVALAPELSGVAAIAQAFILAHVNEVLDVASLGGEDSPRTRLARCLMAAHLGSVTRTGGTGGQVVAERAGELSVAYAYPGGVEGGADESTSYGKQFRALIRASVNRAPVAL